jgi:hypothetical protein
MSPASPLHERALMRLPVRVLAVLPAFALGACGSDEHDHEDGGHPDAAAALDGAVDARADCAPSGVDEAGATRRSEGAAVTVDATLLNALEHCAKPALSFRLVLDTHAVDLLSIDLEAIARVVTSTGTTVATGFAWSGTDESSHHREGVLAVAAPPLEGAAWLRLTLEGVAGVDRSFEWDETLLAHDLP